MKGNHECTYKLYGMDHMMTPDEHFQDIKRVISAIKGHAASMHVVMPLLYASRQHKRKGRESLDRARYYAELLGCDLGVSYKRRDYSIVENGKNPVVEHNYLGKDVFGKDVLIVDDMISSSESILDVALKMKEMGARKVYLSASFALFTNGIEIFDRAYQHNYFDRVYTTNLTSISKNYMTREWLTCVNCMPFLAEVIHTLGNGESVQSLQNGKEKILEIVYKRG